MIPILIDFESRSRIALDETSAPVYAAHESTDVLCMGYSVDGSEPEVWRPGEPFPFTIGEWQDAYFLAYNAAFELAVWNGCCVRKYGWPDLHPRQIHCLQANAAYAGLPRKLAQLSKPLALAELGKDDKGHKNMLRLCKVVGGTLDGREYLGGAFDDSPERHQRNYDYCLQDIVAEAQVHRLTAPLPAAERELWLANHEINLRGVPIDRAFCRMAQAIVKIEQAKLAIQLGDLTGIPDVTPTDLPKLKGWLAEQDIPAWPRTKNGLPQLDNDTVVDALAGKLGPLPDPVTKLLEIRQLTNNSSVAKYTSFLNYATDDDRCQYTHAYYQAGPGRFAGRGPQPQNLPKLDEKTLDDRLQLADRLAGMESPHDAHRHLTDAYEDGPITTLAGMVRLAVKARPGHVLIVSDWSAIEMRMLHWLAGDEHTLQQIRDYDAGKGEEPYKLAAGMMYGKPASEVTKAERQHGKVMILGCGYLQGAEKFQTFCAGYGIEMEFDRAREIVQLYRRSYPLVKRFWYAINKAATNAITKGGRHRVGYLEYYMTGSTLNCRLPSGREIKYWDATVIEGAFGPEVEAINPQTGARRPVSTPILVENADQGASRDLLAAALLRCRAEGLPVVMHIHDEIVCEVLEAEANSALKRLQDIMCDSPPWAMGLPVATGGGTSVRYTK